MLKIVARIEFDALMPSKLVRTGYPRISDMESQTSLLTARKRRLDNVDWNSTIRISLRIPGTSFTDIRH